MTIQCKSRDLEEAEFYIDTLGKLRDTPLMRGVFHLSSVWAEYGGGQGAPRTHQAGGKNPS